MSPKKTSSKKPTASSRAKTRKATTKAVSEGTEKAKLKAAKKKGKKVEVKPAPLTTKPDQMPKDVLEFIQAVDDYKRLEGRPFPTWSEVLEIVKELGYERHAG